MRGFHLGRNVANLNDSYIVIGLCIVNIYWCRKCAHLSQGCNQPIKRDSGTSSKQSPA